MRATVLSSTLFVLAGSTSASFSDHEPGVLVKAGLSQLQPQIWSPLKNQIAKRQPNPLAPLLEYHPQKRKEEACPSGYGDCKSDTSECCPLGGACCSGSRCCDSGNFCYSTGCCKTSEKGCEDKSCCPSSSQCCSNGGCCSEGNYCVKTPDGEVGCCTNGETCTGNPNDTCTDSGYSPCINDNYCCPTGDTCYRDSAGTAECSSSGGGGGGTTSTQKSTVSIPTSTAAPLTSSTAGVTKLTITALSTSSASPSALSTVTLSYTPIPAPSPAAGTRNVTINADDPNIIYAGSSWISVTSTCGSNSTKTSSTAGASFSYAFEGSAIFLSLSETAQSGIYAVNLDNADLSEAVAVDGYSATSQCTYGWSAFGLSDSVHTLSVSIVGDSKSPSSNAGSAFALNNIIVTQSSTTGGSTSGAPVTHTNGGLCLLILFGSALAMFMI